MSVGKIYTWDDFPKEIDTWDYHLNCSKEVFEGTLMCRRKNKNGDIIAYVKLNMDKNPSKYKGLKFVAPKFKRYLGLLDIPDGSNIRVKYFGEKYYLRAGCVEIID